MKKENLKALIGLLMAIGLGICFAFAGSNGRFFDESLNPFAMCVSVAFLIQWIAFVPAFRGQTERFFDLTGSLSYIAVTSLAVFLSPRVDARSFLLLSMVSLWAGRLGWFLYQRIRRAGKDGRFDTLKPSFFRFIGAWTLQGLWITFTLAAALAAITSSVRVNLSVYDIPGVLIWICGLSIEVLADRQKKRFTADPENRGKFIDSGLWSRSRHPNYFGEIVLWAGVAVISIPALQGWQWLTLSSPVFVAFLLIRVSGIPLLEKRSDEKWGGQTEYEHYKQRTPILIPRLASRPSRIQGAR